MDTSPDNIEAHENSSDEAEQVMSEEPARKRRWFRFSPDRFIIGLLAVEVFLFLSEHFQWFAFNEKKGWTVLITVVAMCLAVIVLLLWLAVSLLFRWRFQFSVRSLVLLVVAVAVPCCWLAQKTREAERQRAAVEAIEKAGGFVYLNHATPPVWPLKLIGEELFTTAIGVQFSKDSGDAELKNVEELPELMVVISSEQITDDGLVYLKGLTRLFHLDLTGSQVTDAGLEHLKGLPGLKWLNVQHTQVTAERIEDLRKALPNCYVYCGPPNHDANCAQT